jgi:hypothetical protein
MVSPAFWWASIKFDSTIFPIYRWIMFRQPVISHKYICGIKMSDDCINVFLVTVDIHFDFYEVRNWFISADRSIRIGACYGSGQFDSGNIFLNDYFFVDTGVGAARINHGFNSEVLSIGVSYFWFDDQFLHS